MMWANSQYTVSNNKGNAVKGLRMCDDLGINPTFEPLGPWPVEDKVGFTVSLMMASRQADYNMTCTDEDWD